MFNVIYSIINFKEVIMCTEKVHPVIHGTFAEIVADGQHQTMLNAIPNPLLGNSAMNAEVSH